MAASAASSAALRAQQSAEHLASRFPPLLVAAERVAMTVAQGVHGRRRVGQGEAFWQFRRYQPHDGADQIDWRQTAKSDHVYVRETEWEASQSVWLWRDVSPSMRWRSTARLPEKAERADLLTLALMSLLVRGGELIALLGENARPQTGRATLNRLAQVMAETPADSSGLPPEAALPRYAQVVVIGDFLSPLDQVASAIGRIAGRDVRGFLVQLLDPAEQTLPFAGRTRFEGLEAEGDMLVPRVEAVRREYSDLFEAHVAGLGDIARQVGWNFMSHRTDHPPESAVLALYQALAKPSYR